MSSSPNRSDASDRRAIKDVVLRYRRGIDLDDLAYRDGRWAIAERWAVREWTHRNTVASLPAASGPVGRRDAADPVYLALSRLDES